MCHHRCIVYFAHSNPLSLSLVYTLLIPNAPSLYIYQSRSSSAIMASGRPRGSLSPMYPAKYIAPTSDYVNRPYNTNMDSTHHTSVYSHMRPPSLHMPIVNPRASTTGYTSEAKATAEDNTQPRFELFLLGDGEKKVTEEADTRKLNFLASCKAIHKCSFYTRSSNTRGSRSSTSDCHINVFPASTHFSTLCLQS